MACWLRNKLNRFYQTWKSEICSLSNVCPMQIMKNCEDTSGSLEGSGITPTTLMCSGRMNPNGLKGANVIVHDAGRKSGFHGKDMADYAIIATQSLKAEHCRGNHRWRMIGITDMTSSILDNGTVFAYV